MSTREYYSECFKAEVPKFVRVLKAVPSDQAAYRPHPRSMSAGDLVWLLASELHDACEVVDKGEVNFKQVPPPAKLAESVATYEKNDYHQPSDEIRESWDFSGAVEDARLAFWLGCRVADAPALPRWNKGDEFEAARLRAVAGQ